MTAPHAKRSRWQLPQLLGLDLALFALLWGHAFARLLGINLITDAPMVLLVGWVWLCEMCMRLLHATDTERNDRFYTPKLATLGVLCLSVFLALLWVLFFSVSILLWDYAIPVLILMFLSLLPRMDASLRCLFRALALAFACATPGFYFSITLMPIEMLFFKPIWYLGILFFLFYREDVPASQLKGFPRFFLPLAQFLLFVVCLWLASRSDSYQQAFYYMLITANACLLAISRLRDHLDPHLLQCLRYPIMSLAPLLAILHILY